MKSYSLPAKHYAASWKIESEDHLSTADLTDLGCRYAQAGGQEKEDLLLEICQNFHSYLMKYLAMICRGHVPVWKSRINSDSAAFLKYFLPKGGKLNGDSARSLVRSFHLAFKGMDSGEVYDILMEQFLDAVAKYDPEYTEKVKLVVECMENELSTYKQVRTCDIERHLDLDSNRYLRLLGRRGFLSSVKSKDGKISGWVRTEQWPPPAEFFQSGAIGFAYYLQTWFRYYLQQWIEKRMYQLEAKDGVYSYSNVQRANNAGLRAANEDGTFIRSNADEVLQANHRHKDSKPNPTTDSELSQRPLDIGKLNIEWVDKTEDPLFRDLTRNERYVLYLAFNRSLKPKDLAASLGVTAENAKQLLDDTLAKIWELVDLGTYGI